MVLVSMLVQLLLGVFFTPEGVIKWTHIGPSTARFLHFRYPTWFRYLTGVVEVLIGLGLLVGFWNSFCHNRLLSGPALRKLS